MVFINHYQQFTKRIAKPEKIVMKYKERLIL